MAMEVWNEDRKDLDVGSFQGFREKRFIGKWQVELSERVLNADFPESGRTN